MVCIHNPRMNLSKIGVGGAVAAAALVGSLLVAAPANASSADVPGLTAAEASAMLNETGPDAAIDRELVLLAQVHQSRAEIDRIYDSGRPARMLLDPDTNTFIAAVELYQFGRSLSLVGPGCDSAGLCMSGGARPYGFRGTGTLTGSWDAKRLAAGDHLSLFYYGDYRVAVKKGTSISLPTVSAIKRITR